MKVRINIMNPKDILIKVNHLYKIFGDDDKTALDLVKNGMCKDELLETSNCGLGLNNINLNIFVSESYLIFPVFKKFNTLYLWDKENFWYDFLLEENDQQSLLKIYFPKKSNINRLKISAEQIINMNVDKIVNFLDLYNKKKAIIIFLEQKFDINENKFDIGLQLFSNHFSLFTTNRYF